MANTGRGSGKQPPISDSEPPQELANVVPQPSRAQAQMLDHSYTLQAVMELKGSQGVLTQAIAGLTEAINRQEKQLSKIDDLRVDVGKLDTKIVTLDTELNTVRGKLDSVRMWIVGAAAVVAFISFATPVLIHFWPSPPPPNQNPPQT